MQENFDEIESAVLKEYKDEALSDFLALPEEILLKIILYFSSLRDLGSFAKTSKLCSQLAVDMAVIPHFSLFNYKSVLEIKKIEKLTYIYSKLGHVKLSPSREWLAFVKDYTELMLVNLSDLSFTGLTAKQGAYDIRGLCFSNDSKNLIIVSANKLKVLNIDTMQMEPTPIKVKNFESITALSNDCLAIGEYRDGFVDALRIVNLKTGMDLAVDVEKESSRRRKFYVSENYVITHCTREVKVFEIQVDKETGELTLKKNVIAIHSNGIYVDKTEIYVAINNQVYVYDIKSQERVRSFETRYLSISEIQASSNGTYLIISGHNKEGIIEKYSIHTLKGRLITEVEHGGPKKLFFEKDGNIVIMEKSGISITSFTPIEDVAGARELAFPQPDFH